MNKIISSAVFFSLFIALSSCSKETEIRCGQQDPAVMPTAKEIGALELCAVNGSPEAAMRLSLWHLNSADNEGLYWTKIAAENGSAVGQFNYAIKLLQDKSRPTNELRANFWLQLSAKQGSKEAIAQLQRMRNSKKK